MTYLMEKYQTRSISSNFFGAVKSTSTLLDNAEADTVKVDFDTVNRGDTTSSVSLTQDPSEPILTSTEDLEFKTTPEALEDQGASQGSSEGTQTQQLEPTTPHHQLCQINLRNHHNGEGHI